MKSFFGICVLLALAAVGTTQPTHNSPHHNLEPTQYHTRPENHMGQQEHLMSQPQHHIKTQPEPNIRQPRHYISQPQYNYDSWSQSVEAHTQAQSQTWRSPEELHYQPDEILSPPHHISQPQPHLIHHQPQPLDPQFELHPYPYQHPHYPPTGSHHTQDTGPLYPTHGWNTQNPSVVHQQQLPEPPAPEHYFNANKEDYPNQSSAVASAVATSIFNSVPDFNHEPANPHLFKIISIPKADDGAVYTMPVADHETRHPDVIHTSNDEGLTDIVQEILAKYRPIEIKPKLDNNVPSKEHKSEGLGPVHRPHKQKKNKVPTIPVVTKQSAKAKAVAVAKTGTDKTYTIITGGKHSTSTKAPLKRKHKHSHKKVLRQLLDPEILAKEFEFLSKEFWVPSPDKTRDEDNPIVSDNCTNSDNTDCNDGSKLPDKNKLNHKSKDKHHHKKHLHISTDTTPEKDFPEKTTKSSSYIEPDDEIDADEDTDCDSVNLDVTMRPCNADKLTEKEDKRKRDEPKPTINKNQNINSKPVDPKIEDNSKINPDESSEPCDDDHAADEENQRKKNVLKPKADDKKNYNKAQNKPTNKPTEYHNEKQVQPHTPTVIVPEKDKTKTTMPSTNVKHDDQKDAEWDSNFDSAESDKSAEPHDTVNDPEKEDETVKPLPETKPNDKRKGDSEAVDNDKGNIEKITDNKVAQKKEEKIVETKKEETVQQTSKTKQQPESYVEKEKEQDFNTSVCDVCDSIKASVTQVPYNEIPALEHKDKKQQSTPNTNKDENEPQPEKTNKGNNKTLDKNKQKHHRNKKTLPHFPKNTASDKDIANFTTPSTYTKRNDKENPEKNEGKKNVPKPNTDDKQNNDTEKITPKKKPNPQHDNKQADSHTPTNILPGKNETKTTMPSTKLKPGDKKDAHRDNYSVSADSDEATEPRDKDDSPEKERHDTKKYLTKPETDVKKNTDSKPVDNKGKIDTITDNKVVQKNEIKKVERKKEDTISEKIKQQPETYGDRQKNVEQDYKAPVSDKSDSTKGSVNQEPCDKIPAPENKAKKDENKLVSPDTHKRNKDEIIIAKNDVKKMEQTKEVTQKVDTKKEANIDQAKKKLPKPHKYEDKLKPDKQEDKSSDIEDCYSTESNEPQSLFDKNSALKEPLSKANQDKKASKDLTKDKKIVEIKEEKLKIEKKTEKSTQNVVPSEAVYKSKPVEKSNENSDIDDCDSADSETDRKPDKTKTTEEKHDPKKKKTEEVIKKKVARNKADGKATGKELTSDVVAEILEKSETDQPLSTVGFLISLISHALRGDSVKQMFEEPKIKTFVKGFINS